MTESPMFTNPIYDTRMLDQLSDASPNTGRTLAGAANATTFAKKLRKKEDDMRCRPAMRVVAPVTTAEKDSAINKHDENHPRYREKKHERSLLSPAMEDEDIYEPYVGVLVDYTA